MPDNNLVCNNCSKGFYLKPSAIAKGYGKFCSRKCRKEFGYVEERITDTIDKQCPWCKNIFTVRDDYYGKKKKFCSRTCADSWIADNQRKDPKSRTCKYCKQEFVIQGNDLSRRKKQKFCSKGCYGRWRSENIRGKKHPGWKGGVPVEYGRRFSRRSWHYTKAKVLKRDRDTCQECGKEWTGGTKFHVDHIVPYRISEDNSIGNLQTLCPQCHASKTAIEREEYA